MARSERRLWPWAVVAFLAVGFLCVFHAFAALMECGEDADTDPGFLTSVGPMTPAMDGWMVRSTSFAPLGLVLVGSVLAVFAKRPTALAIVAIVSLGLALAGFLAGPLLFG